MKKVFTLVLAMTIVITGFAQVKNMSRKAMKHEAAQQVVLTGMEERDYANFPAPTNRGVVEAPGETEMSYTFYDWQTNAASRNFVATWPDGYAVVCFTQATNASCSDRGTGLAIWDPAVGEWEYTETRVEGVRTGFGSIARYKENGLVLAAHTSNDCRIFIVEDFRQGTRDFGEGIILPTEGDDGRVQDPCWPSVQCSGENLDIIHIINTEYSLTTPYKEALLYTRYQDGEFVVKNHIIPNLDEDNISAGDSNISYFLAYNPEKPNRVSFVLNNAWSDGKVVVSEDNGENWSDRVFFQHPGIYETFAESFFYPRWVSAEFDADDNIHLVYEYNGTTGEPGSGSYYPAIGGIGYWSENLPKNELCLGGIGNVGQPFILDTAYLDQDLYYSEWYWSDALHDALPEYIGELEIVDENGMVIPRESATGYLPTDGWSDHGSYNSGKAAFPSMHMDGNRIFAFWSMLAGSAEEGLYYSGEAGQFYFRLYCNVSNDGGNTWVGTKELFNNANANMKMYDEMVYGQLVPFVYNDAEGEYLWYVYQLDSYPGTFIMEDDPDGSDNLYAAVKVYVSTIDGVDEDSAVATTNTMTVYPNPANGSFALELTNEADVNIFNAVGQLVKTYENVKSLNVNLEAGIYFVQSGNQTQKVVVF